MSDQDEDPYAVSSDSEDEVQGPPPKINIEERAVADLTSIVRSSSFSFLFFCTLLDFFFWFIVVVVIDSPSKTTFFTYFKRNGKNLEKNRATKK